MHRHSKNIGRFFAFGAISFLLILSFQNCAKMDSMQLSEEASKESLPDSQNNSSSLAPESSSVGGCQLALQKGFTGGASDFYALLSTDNVSACENFCDTELAEVCFLDRTQRQCYAGRGPNVFINPTSNQNVYIGKCNRVSLVDDGKCSGKLQNNNYALARSFVNVATAENTASCEAFCGRNKADICAFHESAKRCYVGRGPHVGVSSYPSNPGSYAGVCDRTPSAPVFKAGVDCKNVMVENIMMGGVGGMPQGGTSRSVENISACESFCQTQNAGFCSYRVSTKLCQATPREGGSFLHVILMPLAPSASFSGQLFQGFCRQNL